MTEALDRVREAPTLRRQTPKVGAVCGKAARTVLCGGRGVTRVPTAIQICSYSIGESHRRGLLVVSGVVLADLTWAVLAASGLGVLILRYPAIYTVLQIAGAAYLIWLARRRSFAQSRLKGGGTSRHLRAAHLSIRLLDANAHAKKLKFRFHHEMVRKFTATPIHTLAPLSSI